MFVRTLALMLAATGLLVPAVNAPAAATPDHFTPRAGPTFNNPTGDNRRQKAIFRRLIRSINSTPRGADINIFSWNFLSGEGKQALLRAQRRGVRVRLLMDERNVQEIDNPPFKRLRRGLRKGNHHRPRARRSWARVCEGTCRGGRGSAHSKFFMFSKAGKNRRVVIQGSANLTLAAANRQWNDTVTHTGRKRVWGLYRNVFNQAARDKRVAKQYRRRSFKNFELIFFPLKGRRNRDPIARMLNRTRCGGAQNTASGKTVIRIAPDVIRHQRGLRLAKKLRSMHNNGCNIRVGYTVISVKAGRLLRRAGVPIRHFVKDFDDDGQFDRYFHLKAMTIRGNYAGNRRGFAVINGSANWSGLARRSDENVAIYRNRRWVTRYQDHIDYWWTWFRKTEPKARLVFGADERAIYANGEPVTDGEVDPFAAVDVAD